MIVTPSPTHAPAPPPSAVRGAPALGVAFPGLLLPAAEQPAAEPARQDVAGDGKDLPADDTAPDAWLATISLMVASPPPVDAEKLPAPVAAANQPASAAPAIAPMPVSVSAPAQDVMPTAAPTMSTTALPVNSDAMQAQMTTPSGPQAKQGSDAGTKDMAPPRTAPAAVAAPTATMDVIASFTERPAPLVQGLVTTRATAPANAGPIRVSDRERTGETRAEASFQLPLVAAAIAPHRTMLDLRQEHWPERMIAHIETLRDAADANDTRIRLVPDALGTVDVQLRREGETVHVAFAAERAETRALLDQAQPKLAELGEARGLRFAQSGGDQGGGQPQHRAAPAPRPAPAPSRAATEPDTADDIDPTRIA